MSRKQHKRAAHRRRRIFPRAQYCVGGLAVAGLMTFVGPKQAQAAHPLPAFASASDNPFGLADVGSSSSPSFADLDGDGDLDAFIGESYGNTKYFQNTGTAISPAFASATDNPFGLADVGSSASPSFADLDGDGDVDAFIGEMTGSTQYFQNTGTAISLAFASASVNPFGLAYVGNSSAPSFADRDEASDPNPSSPSFADLDGDGDLDAFIGERDGDTRFLQNTGTATSPVFAAASHNPFGLADVGSNATPSFADLDGDGDLDAFMGESGGDAKFFENTGTATSPAFAAASDNPFGLTDVGSYSSPSFADLDGDGDLDAFIG
jgi:hypothetical protein